MTMAANASKNDDDELLPFVFEDYVKNPVASARMNARLTK